jgi:hypothetical protein
MVPSLTTLTEMLMLTLNRIGNAVLEPCKVPMASTAAANRYLTSC